VKYLRTSAIVVLVLGLCGWIAYHYGWLQRFLPSESVGAGERSTSMNISSAADSGVLCMLGWLEPAEGCIDVHGTPGDRIDSIEVREDDLLKKDQLLAKLESLPLKQLEVEALRAQVAEATARRAAESKMAEVRIQSAQLGVEKVELQGLEEKSLAEKIKLLQATLALAEKDFKSLSDLRARPRTSGLSDDVVSAQELERQRLVVDKATTDLSAAQAELKRLQQTRDLSARAAKAELDAAKAAKDQAITAIPVESAQRKLEAAQAQLKLVELKAPCPGTVLRVFARPGESIGHKPVLRMADLHAMVVQAEVYDVDVKRLSVGQKATIESKAFPAPHDEEGLTGKIVSIGRMVNTPELRSLDPFARVDRHVVPVRILLDKPHTPIAARYVNLQVDVKIWLKEGP
jgi:HlyD family secretion protein